MGGAVQRVWFCWAARLNTPILEKLLVRQTFLAGERPKTEGPASVIKDESSSHWARRNLPR